MIGGSGSVSSGSNSTANKIVPKLKLYNHSVTNESAGHAHHGL